MARLIDADKIKYDVRTYGGWGRPEEYVTKYYIDRMPTVDAVEVVHGRWLYDSGNGMHFCSACDEFAIEQLHMDSDGVEYYEGYLTDYCPNCGAKMDLEDE